MSEPKSPSSPSADYIRFVRPHTGEQMHLLQLDWRFFRAEGDWIWGTSPLGTDVRVLDLLGGYGTNLWGHNPADWIQDVKQFFDDKQVQQAQLSLRTDAAEASREMSRAFEPVFREACIVHWASSGSEAVEVALQHALMKYQFRRDDFPSCQRGLLDALRTKRLTWGESGVTVEQILERQQQVLAGTPIVLTLERSFHGRTVAAMGASDSPLLKYLPSTMGVQKITLDLEKPEAWLEQVQLLTRELPYLVERQGQVVVERGEWSPVVGLLVEPVQGEGGIYALGENHVKALQDIAGVYSLDLIADEIQCGLGRTGHLSACESIGLRPDVIVLGKALGVGLTKVSAVLIRRSRYQKNLSRLGSTFSEDDLSCHLAREAVLRAESASHLQTVREKGGAMLGQLQDLRAEFTDVLVEARGRGLMLGLEFRSWQDNPSNMLRLFQGNHLSGYLMASFLLNRHGVRVAPSLSNPGVLRFEPSVHVEPAQVGQLISGLRELCEALRRGDFAMITKHLWDPENKILFDQTARDFRMHPRASRFDRGAVSRRIGFFGHLLRFEDLGQFDPSMEAVPREVIEPWYRQGEGFFKPSLFERVHLPMPGGEVLEVNIIGLYETPASMIHAFRNRESSLILTRLQQGLELAKELGCEVMGLGGLTSVLAKNGYALDSLGMGLTTGNTYTLVTSCQALERVASEMAFPLEGATVAVVGASGNIGEAYAHWLAGKARKVILIGRPARETQLQEVARELRQKSVSEIAVSIDMSVLADCDFVVSVTNAPGYVIVPEDLSPKVKAILDVATPADVDPRVLTECPHVRVLQGGWVKIPGLEGYLGSAFPTPPGHTLACMAETMLLGLRSHRTPFSYGPLEKDKIKKIADWARESGFELGQLIGAEDVKKDKSVHRAHAKNDFTRSKGGSGL